MAASKSDQPRMVPIGALRENPWNPNRMDEATHQATVANIRRFGFNGAIVARPARYDEDDPRGYVVGAGGDLYEIVDGAHRYRAAKEIGIDKVPVVVRELTDAEAKAQTLAMNQLRGEMAPEDVARLVREIDEGGIDRDSLLEFSGFTSADLDALDASWGQSKDESTSETGDGTGGGSGAQDQSDDLTEQYVVVVTCVDEAAQLALAERLEGEGYSTRLVIG